MQKETTILLTGFEPFPGVDENPTQRIVASFGEYSLPGHRLVTEILPVAYVRADDRIRALVRQYRPAVILMTGVAGKTDPIRLERVALNLDDAKIPDNDDVLRQGTPILHEAPAAYFSSLPLPSLEQALTQAGIPVRISNHAGAYLCNHVFFAAAHEAEQRGLSAQVGFVHVPMHQEKAEESQMTLAQIRQAILICLEYFSPRAA